MDPTTIDKLGRNTCLEYIDLPERDERLAPAPEEIMKSPVGDLIKNHTGNNMLWEHQSAALQELLNGHNTVIATGTASGKSLIFQAWTFYQLNINPQATTIVFDPLRALAEDQLQSWKRMAEQNGMSSETVTKIDGSIPIPDRENMLRQASIVIMTPDVCHAWLMRNSNSRVVQEFIENLSSIILDEAHVYDSVFGSNASYLFRRLMTMRSHATGGDENLRIIAATATISNAAEHLEKLTGLPFKEITEEQNGARIFPRRLMHIEGNYEYDLLPIIQHILTMGEKFIVFCDSRQGVERIARQIGNDNQVSAYRSGYEAEDRRNIEVALREGTLKGVISTSALELGINIPGLTLGVNFKLPNTRKSFRQRLGRIGRDGPGLFAVVAPSSVFSEFGDTLKTYYESSVEPSLLYLGNKYVQFTNAQCLAKESGIRAPENGQVEWPQGFDDIIQYAMSGKWPDQYRLLGRAGQKHPHVAHPLRSIATDDIELVDKQNNKRIGTITISQALREAYPMATYIHRGRTYRAGIWNPEGQYGKTEIPLEEAGMYEKTEPISSMEITIKGIVNHNIALHTDSSKGYAAEVFATVTDKTIGYSSKSSSELYRPEQQPTRVFDTTGVLLRIKEPWCNWMGPRQEVSSTLKRFTCYDQSVASWDISNSEEPLTIVSTQNPDGEVVDDALIVFDNTHGSLRLTEALYHKLPDYIERLRRSIDLEGETINQDVIRQLGEWTSGLMWKALSKSQ